MQKRFLYCIRFDSVYCQAEKQCHVNAVGAPFRLNVVFANTACSSYLTFCKLTKFTPFMEACEKVHPSPTLFIGLPESDTILSRYEFFSYLFFADKFLCGLILQMTNLAWNDFLLGSMDIFLQYLIFSWLTQIINVL